jgi:hypothetical protein
VVGNVPREHRGMNALTLAGFAGTLARLLRRMPALAAR